MAAKCTLAARVDSFHESTEGKVRAAVVSAWSVACRGGPPSEDPPHGHSQGGAGVSLGPIQGGAPSPTLP